MSLITMIIGFMMAIQFQAVKEPVIRDTRDTGQLRDDLVKEKELYLNLIREINSNEEKIEQYETEKAKSKEWVLQDTLNELKIQAGLTEVEAPGIIIKIEYANEQLLLGETITPISYYLIQSLVIVLNQYGAENIAINEQSLFNSTVIREINGLTKVNGYSLDMFPITIQVAAGDREGAEKLYKRMQVSKSAEDFFLENYRLSISEPQLKVIIPAYKDPIRIQYMELEESE